MEFADVAAVSELRECFRQSEERFQLLEERLQTLENTVEMLEATLAAIPTDPVELS